MSGVVKSQELYLLDKLPPVVVPLMSIVLVDTQ